MKRPLAVFGFSLFAFLLCFVVLDSRVLVGVLFFLAVAAVITVIASKKLRRLDTLVTVFAALSVSCLLFLFADAKYKNTIELCSEKAFVSGTVCKSPEFSSDNARYYSVIRVDSIDEEKVNTKMRLSFRKSWDRIDPEVLTVGSRISFYGQVYQLGAYGGEQYVDYYKSRGIFLGAYSVDELTVNPPAFRTFAFYISRLRDYITDKLSHDFNNDVAAVLTAILTGEKDSMENEVYDAFRRAGVLHIMAVSGLHLSVWIVLMTILLDTVGRRRRFSYVLLMTFVFFMMCFADYTGSVCRAGMMSLLFLTAKLLKKDSDALNNLGFSCICILFYNPFSVINISFMLSFISTLSILIMGVPLTERISELILKKRERLTLRKILYPIILSVSVSLSVMMFTLPVCIYYFGGISLASTITNLLFYAVVTPVVLLTGIYPLLRLVPYLGYVCAVVLDFLSGYMIRVCEYIASFEYAYVNISTNIFGVLLIGAGVAVFSFLLIKKCLKGCYKTF